MVRSGAAKCQGNGEERVDKLSGEGAEKPEPGCGSNGGGEDHCTPLRNTKKDRARMMRDPRLASVAEVGGPYRL